MLVATVLKASLTEAPTRGTKLLIAKRAVFKVRLSELWDNMFFVVKININIDITKTVTEVKVVFNVFEIPLKLPPPSGLMQAKDIQSFTRGSIKPTKNASINDISTSISVFKTTALERLPFIMLSVVISGTNAFITLDSVFKYEPTVLESEIQTLNTVSVTTRIEHIENDFFNASFVNELARVEKIDDMISKISIPENTLITSSTLAKR